jgi:ABC-2 type transport system ATP-binding protein
VTAGRAPGHGTDGPAGDGAGGHASQPAILVEGLVKRYGERTVVDGVSLSVAAGELLAVLGPNGAGKTTTVEIVEGYRRADGGRVRVLGSDPATGGPGLRARVGLMLQDGGVDPRAQPLETIRQYGRFHRDPRDADELVDLVGLRAVARTRYRRLSGGERQRLGLALALVGRPEVVILDEPTAGMDPEARAATRAIVSDLRDAGAAILLTSHDLTDVERLADRICVLDHGRIVASGTAAELAGAVVRRLRFRLDRPLVPTELEALGRSLAAARTGATVVAEPDGARYRVKGAEPDAALVAALADWCAVAGRLIVELRTAGGTLEETYLALVGTGSGAGDGAAGADPDGSGISTEPQP